ncbi:class I SAM-dependent DNA methyltransferase [Streptomyces zingiberis]|uniref:Methyltransferase domain-containing protein n=1 Tax=Streptomyces zingiberis TaxID=2053010 RepID=A0ABX1BXM7_9ACTN|nr:class I SAM-dependent methyltransferase [Streptomyces zingiberis]NJQ00487.1 methyltransferase domain-containing protein [Streptomyces zingiberis]
MSGGDGLRNAPAADGYAGYDRSAIDRSGQAEAFDAIATRYTEAFPHREGQLAAGAWLAASLPPGSRVLDVGCGTGVPTAAQLAAAGHHVVGIDLSATMVELARENVPQGEFHRRDVADLGPRESGAPEDPADPTGPGNLEDLGGLEDLRGLGDLAALGDVAALGEPGEPGDPDASADHRDLGLFDGAAAFFSLLMLPRAEIPHALRTIHHLLRPGGLLALSMVEADVDDAVIPFLGHPIRVSGYPRDELRQVVRAAGFEIAGEDSYAYAPASTEVPPEIQLFLHCRRRA